MSGADTDPCSLRAIDGVHHALSELFLLHQEDLLAFDIDRAERKLVQYEAALRLHIGHEEEHLLPVYEHPDLPRRARAEAFSLEHAKILQKLGEIQAQVRDLHGRNQLRPRRLLSLLEREATFKQLVHHHERREMEFLFPSLDARLSKAERMALLSRCDREWRDSGLPRGLYLGKPSTS